MRAHAWGTKWNLCSILLVITMPDMIMFAQENIRKCDNEHGSSQLGIELSFSKSKASIKDRIIFDVKLINEGKDKITVSNKLELGYAAGLLLIISDEVGHSVSSSSKIYYFIPPPPRDSSSYISLFPSHYYGATLWSKSEDLFVKPGKYSVFAAYWNNQTENYAEERFRVKDLWGVACPPIESLPVWIEITGD